MKKIAGVSLWLWGIGCLVLAGGVFAIKTAMASSANQPVTPIERKQASASSRKAQLVEIDQKASEAFLAVRALNWKRYAKAQAEIKLEKETSPGKAQLAAIEYKEASDEEQQAEKEYDEKVSALRESEGDSGIDSSSKLFVKIAEFAAYCGIVILEYKLDLKHDGYLSPNHQSLQKEVFRVMGDVTLEDLRHDVYQGELIDRLHAERAATLEEWNKSRK